MSSHHHSTHRIRQRISSTFSTSSSSGPAPATSPPHRGGGERYSTCAVDPLDDHSATADEDDIGALPSRFVDTLHGAASGSFPIPSADFFTEKGLKATEASLPLRNMSKTTTLKSGIKRKCNELAERRSSNRNTRKSSKAPNDDSSFMSASTTGNTSFLHAAGNDKCIDDLYADELLAELNTGPMDENTNIEMYLKHSNLGHFLDGVALQLFSCWLPRLDSSSQPLLTKADFLVENFVLTVDARGANIYLSRHTTDSTRSSRTNSYSGSPGGGSSTTAGGGSTASNNVCRLPVSDLKFINLFNSFDEFSETSENDYIDINKDNLGTPIAATGGKRASVRQSLKRGFGRNHSHNRTQGTMSEIEGEGGSAASTTGSANSSNTGLGSVATGKGHTSPASSHTDGHIGNLAPCCLLSYQQPSHVVSSGRDEGGSTATGDGGSRGTLSYLIFAFADYKKRDEFIGLCKEMRTTLGLESYYGTYSD